MYCNTFSFHVKTDIVSYMIVCSHVSYSYCASHHRLHETSIERVTRKQSRRICITDTPFCLPSAGCTAASSIIKPHQWCHVIQFYALPLRTRQSIPFRPGVHFMPECRVSASSLLLLYNLLDFKNEIDNLPLCPTDQNFSTRRAKSLTHCCIYTRCQTHSEQSHFFLFIR